MRYAVHAAVMGALALLLGLAGVLVFSVGGNETVALFLLLAGWVAALRAFSTAARLAKKLFDDAG